MENSGENIGGSLHLITLIFSFFFFEIWVVMCDMVEANQVWRWKSPIPPGNPHSPGQVRKFGHLNSRGKGEGLKVMLNVDISLENGRGS